MHDGASPSIRARMGADHRELELMMTCLIEASVAGDEPEIERLWALFKSRLSAHIDREERYLLPAVQRRAPRVARTIREEQRHIRARSAELGLGVAGRSMRLDAVRSFITELRAHARSEDRLLYVWADEHLDADEHALALSFAGSDTGDASGLSEPPPVAS